jgi:DNA-3-methyladenine glycosylase I
MAPRSTAGLRRCSWAEDDPLLRAYHDSEWGVPEHDSRALWEKLMLDGFQAGLSWLIILRKREAFRRAFEVFDPARVARFGPADVTRLLADPGIVRSRQKIEATIRGARAYLAMQAEGIDFSSFAWEFVGGTPIQNSGPVPAQTDLSGTISAALKARGFQFVGPVIVYAWMQANGLVNDHAPTCFRRDFGRTGGRPRASRLRAATSTRPPGGSAVRVGTQRPARGSRARDR